MQLSLGQGETHQAREERAICFGDKARRNRLDSIQKASLPRNIPLDLFFFHVRLFRSKAAPRETMAPVCQEASGSRRPFVKGITSPAPSCPIRQRILKFRRISVARGITTVFFAPYPPRSTLSRSTPSPPFSSSVSLPAVHSINGSEYATEHSAFRGFFQPPFSYTCARFSSLLNTRASFCFEWNATVQWSGLQLRVDYEIHSPEPGLGLIV